MGRRTIRFRRQDIPEKLSSLPLQSEIHVVLESGITLFGKLVQIQSGYLTLTEGKPHWYNLRQHTHTISFQDIEEIESDQVTLY